MFDAEVVTGSGAAMIKPRRWNPLLYFFAHKRQKEEEQVRRVTEQHKFPMEEYVNGIVANVNGFAPRIKESYVAVGDASSFPEHYRVTPESARRFQGLLDSLPENRRSALFAYIWNGPNGDVSGVTPRYLRAATVLGHIDSLVEDYDGTMTMLNERHDELPLMRQQRKYVSWLDQQGGKYD